ncbi:hypothetical protein NX059_009415 [Plenodomus lindquistii]|nr:hypothetical protein NX059_009415 [Plenodomus lindquistii]
MGPFHSQLSPINTPHNKKHPPVQRDLARSSPSPALTLDSATEPRRLLDDIMRIQKTLSAPADPGEPSFLTTLPAEIRNMIYEIMFKRDGHVLLHNSAAYHDKKPHRHPTTSQADHENDLEAFYRNYEQDICNAREFRHGFHHHVAVLLACRQVYHEAVGVLYGQNFFMFARAHRSCNRNFSYSYLSSSYADAWLSGLGSQAELLRGVVIDMDTMCSSQYLNLISIDLLPLARHIWSRPTLGSVIKFGNSGRLSAKYHVDHKTFTGSLVAEHAELLNNTLIALCVDDQLKLKRYNTFSRLLGYMDFSPLSGTVQVAIGGMESAHITDWNFTSENGRILTRVSEPEPKPKLDSLPDHILEHISSIVFSGLEPMVLDLGERKLRGLQLGVLQVNQRLRNGLNPGISDFFVHDIIVKVKSSKTRMDSDNFSSLKGLIGGQDSLFTIETLVLNPEENNGGKITVHLEFVLDSFATLSQLRINLKPAMELFGRMNPINRSTVEITLECPWATRSRKTTAIFALATLQKHILLLLSDVVQQRSSASSTEYMLLPDIWINGEGTVIEACTSTPTTPSVISFHLEDMTSEELRIYTEGRCALLRKFCDQERKRFRRKPSSERYRSMMHHCQNLSYHVRLGH